MENIVLIANLLVLLLIIIFAVKIRSDFEELKRSVGEKEKKEENPLFEEIRFKVVSLEDRVVSLEYDSKEIREKIGILSREIDDVLRELKNKKAEEEKKSKFFAEGEFVKALAGASAYTKNAQNTGKTQNTKSERIRMRQNEREEENTIEQKVGVKVGFAESEGDIKNEGGIKTEGDIKTEGEIKDAVMMYAMRGMKPEDIAKLLGITYEEVKLILLMGK